MTKSIRFLFIVFLFISTGSFAQLSVTPESAIQKIILDPAKVAKFEIYCSWKHDLEPGGFAQWKANNPDKYLGEMWYYTESFYIKRDHLTSGVALPEEIIDISRFETQRQATTEVIVTIGGVKDAIVLIPRNKLIYKVK